MTSPNTPRNWLDQALGRDEGREEELRRIDPYDLLGWTALIATLLNIVVSAVKPTYMFDALISVSFLFGVLSILNRGSLPGKIALGVMLVHAAAMHFLRLL